MVEIYLHLAYTASQAKPQNRDKLWRWSIWPMHLAPVLGNFLPNLGKFLIYVFNKESIKQDKTNSSLGTFSFVQTMVSYGRFFLNEKSVMKPGPGFAFIFHVVIRVPFLYGVLWMSRCKVLFLSRLWVLCLCCVCRWCCREP